MIRLIQSKQNGMEIFIIIFNSEDRTIIKTSMGIASAKTLIIKERPLLRFNQIKVEKDPSGAIGAALTTLNAS